MDNEMVGFILAAGDGKRLKELTKDRPKSFLEINGKKLIEYHLENLHRLGIKKAYIVVGFLKDLFKKTAGHSYKGMSIIYIDNDEFEVTGHSYSLFLGRDIFKENSILLVHADVFCDPSLYDEALNSGFENVLLVDENYKVLTGDEFVVQGENNIVHGIGPDKSGKIQGEFVGISKFSPEFLTALCDYMDGFFKKESKKFNYEILMDNFLKATGFRINYKKINGKKWVNVNYMEDYEKAKSISKDLEKTRLDKKEAINCGNFFNLLNKNGIEFFCGVPDSLLKDFNAYILDNVSRDRHVIVANEGAAVALATGYHLATGKIPLVYMQNAGQGNAVNPLVSLADKEVYNIPMILMIGWRGHPDEKDEPQHVKQGKITLGLLDVLEIKYEILPKNINEAESTINRLVKSVEENGTPHAIVVRKDTFSPYYLSKSASSEYNITREEAIKEIANNLGEDDLVVSTTGKASRELFEHREDLGQGHEKDFLTVGSMGHSSQIALGISLQKPGKNIYCFDGDGSIIMHMGSLAVIGQLSPKNLKHIVFNNGAHDSVGGQPTAGFVIDIPKIAESCGYKRTLKAETKEELLEKLKILNSSEGPALLEIRIAKGARENLGRPTKTPVENKKDFMEFLSK